MILLAGIYYPEGYSWQSALTGMVTGTVVLVLWKQVGLSGTMYEIVPGFIANCLTIFLVNLFIGQKDERGY